MDWDLPLQPQITELLDASSGVVKILDVGAGPLTSLGKKWGSREIAITAIDPHAKEYDALLARLGIEPACRTTVGSAEELSKFLPGSHFDLVHARNSMDHSKDPFQAIREMVKVVRPGKYVLLDHKIREGEAEEYWEYHQWNFFPRRSRFYIERPGMRAVDVGKTLSGIADVSVGPSPDGPEHFCAKIRRIA
jgi:SAM-dependent methyltransferase